LDFTNGKFMTKKTKQAISSLDWAIAQTVQEPRQPDEFTIAEYAEKAGIGTAQAGNRLKRLKGLTSRVVTIKGNRVNLFRKA